MNKSPQNLMHWHYWSFFGVRWLFLVMLSMVLVVFSSQGRILLTGAEVGRAFVIGAAINLILALFIYYVPLNRLLPSAVVVGDVIIAAMFVAISGANNLLVLGVVAGLTVSGVLLLDRFWALTEALSVYITLFLTLAFVLDTAAFNQALAELVAPTFISVLFTVTAGVWGYTLNEQTHARLEEFKNVASKESDRRSELEVRTKGLYEVTEQLGSTMDYTKILDSALDAGWLGLRGHIGKERLVSAVLLFSSVDDKLHIATSRGMSRSDEARALPGRSGILGQALTECIPITIVDPHKDPELQYYVSYQGLRSALCIPLRSNYENYGVLLYGSQLPKAFTDEYIELLTAIGRQATIALQNAVLYTNLVEEKKRILDKEEDARKQLARDLHDGPTQTISAILMRIGIIYDLLEKNPSKAAIELAKVEQLARNTVKDIRHMLFTLRPLVLETQGLASALNQLAYKTRDVHDQKVSIYIDHDAEFYLTKPQQTAIFYIIEEGLNNARKHAQADLIRVDVSHQDDVVAVLISDNGVGFDTSKVSSKYEFSGSLGMTNMRERAESVNGMLTVESNEGKGTIITLLVPVKTYLGDLEVYQQSSMPKTKLAQAAMERVEDMTFSKGA